ncbi:hypothetical protein NDU88_006955 [Pleurodeles waltl]|uniref:Uncharacterized protein n=1 Tax=Pleurodeles waltl TaxID=8319 RepID=A0AAV7SRE7_PLEWA|nr:hypothetical protein NDU88_006955 [Pleurodeles waltl]
MLHKAQHWGVENMILVKTGLMDIWDQGQGTVEEVTFEEVQAVEGVGRGRISGVFRAGSELIAPGCGGSLASSGQEEQVVKAGQGRPAFIAGHTVGVGTPLRHRQEERVRPGAAHLTSGETLVSSQVRQRYMSDEPSASQGTSYLNLDVGFDETLDFEDVDERGLGRADLVEVSQGNNQSRSCNVLQGRRHWRSRAIVEMHKGLHLVRRGISLEVRKEVLWVIMVGLGLEGRGQWGQG